jgi:hypothetical protein
VEENSKPFNGGSGTKEVFIGLEADQSTPESSRRQARSQLTVTFGQLHKRGIARGTVRISRHLGSDFRNFPVSPNRS